MAKKCKQRFAYCNRTEDNDCPLVLPQILENYLMQTEGNNTVIARSVLFTTEKEQEKLWKYWTWSV